MSYENIHRLYYGNFSIVSVICIFLKNKYMIFIVSNVRYREICSWICYQYFIYFGNKTVWNSIYLVTEIDTKYTTDITNLWKAETLKPQCSFLFFQMYILLSILLMLILTHKSFNAVLLDIKYIWWWRRVRFWKDMSFHCWLDATVCCMCIENKTSYSIFKSVICAGKLRKR